MNIKVLVQLKEYTLIKDNITGYVWLYSYQKPIAWWEGDNKIHHPKLEKLTKMSQMHLSWFEKKIKGGFIL